MANFTIANASNIPLNIQQGTIPNLFNALNNWLQTITFGKVTKSNVAFQAVEVMEEIVFQGTVQPFKARDLLLLPEGQRAWSWFQVITKAAPGGALINLDVDDVGIWNGIQTRVVSQTYNVLYGTLEMTWVQDYTNSGPTPT